jgi:hypothetical protein
LYFVAVLMLTLILPLISVGVELAYHPEAHLAALVCKWFTLWAVGVRLAMAGLRQVFQPGYTAHVILGLKGDEPLLVVRELGFANLCMGVLGLCSLWVPGWATAGALVGGLFYGMAGVNHALRPHRNAKENTAMATDLLASVALLVSLAVLLFTAPA